jgi:hypothetical protein
MDKIVIARYFACSFKFILQVGVEESIVNAPRITDHGSLRQTSAVCSHSTLQRQKILEQVTSPPCFGFSRKGIFFVSIYFNLGRSDSIDF